MTLKNAQSIAKTFSGQVRAFNDENGERSYLVMLLSPKGAELLLTDGGWMIDDLGESEKRFYNCPE